MEIPIKFQSTPLMRGATGVAGHASSSDRFQSTPLMRGATGRAGAVAKEGEVSIHAPHARGDTSRDRCRRPTRSFNPRPSCEGRLDSVGALSGKMVFQSTPLMRGATWNVNQGVKGEDCFNPRPSCEGRLGHAQELPRRDGVSIHAPHARGDSHSRCPWSMRSSFNPRPSCEGRLYRRSQGLRTRLVSIHAPHARGDFSS